jgi:predicted nucleic acid-binding protein
MRQRVYLETTVPSYLTAWPSGDLVRAAHQRLTREWWERRRMEFDLVASQLVLDECGAGDAVAAAARLGVLAGVPLLSATDSVGELAADLQTALALPPRAANDAVHLAFAAVHGIDYLLTWNCTHLANAALRGKIHRACRARGLEPPAIATPEELMGDAADVG